jgi:hypothetical protein
MENRALTTQGAMTMAKKTAKKAKKSTKKASKKK